MGQRNSSSGRGNGAAGRGGGSQNWSWAAEQKSRASNDKLTSSLGCRENSFVCFSALCGRIHMPTEANAHQPVCRVLPHMRCGCMLWFLSTPQNASKINRWIPRTMEVTHSYRNAQCHTHDTMLQTESQSQSPISSGPMNPFLPDLCPRGPAY